VHTAGPEKQIVSCDEFTEGYDAAAHLIRLGHTRIAFVTDALVPGMRHENWLAGYVAALAIEKLPVASELIQTSFTPYKGIPQMAQKLMKLPKPPTAFVVPDARGARELIDALSNLQIELGPQSLVLGGDTNTIRLQRVGNFPHILQDVDRIAEQAVDHLMWLSQNRPSGGSEIMVPSIYENF
jgi:DNA-binding LacI/PurR family transcriptional regulator